MENIELSNKSNSIAQLVIKNIGNIGNAIISIDKNCSIAGHNNIGKSTITKIIFSIIKAQKKSNELYLNFIDKYSKASSFKEKQLLKYNFEEEYSIGTVIEIKKFEDTLKERLYKKYLVKYLFSTLGEYYLRQGSKKGSIIFSHNTFSLQCLVSDIGPLEINISGEYSWYEDSTLISSTEILNFANLINTSDTVIDEKYNTTKLVSAQDKDLIEKLNEVFADMLDDNFQPIHGLYFNKYGYAFYKEKEKNIDIKVLGTGKKLFAIMERLILNKSINKNTLLLLDEPEEGMHPEWQLNFINFLLTTDIPFILTTHSPYVIQSLVYYTKDMNKQISYYTVKHLSIEGFAICEKESRPLKIVKDLTNPILKVRGF